MKIKLYLILFFIIIIIFQAKKLITNIQLSDIYYINFDRHFSLNLRSEIKDFINEKLKNKKPQLLYKELKNQFSIIKSITIQRKNSDLLTIAVIAFEPIYQINNDLIFTEKKNLFELSLFKNDSTANLEIIGNKEHNSSEFLNFLDKFPRYLINEFEVEWHNKNLIYLKNKLDKNFILLITHIIPDKKIIENCKKIKHENYIDNKKQIIADLRFLNQIIISQI